MQSENTSCLAAPLVIQPGNFKLCRSELNLVVCLAAVPCGDVDEDRQADVFTDFFHRAVTHHNLKNSSMRAVVGVFCHSLIRDSSTVAETFCRVSAVTSVPFRRPDRRFVNNAGRGGVGPGSRFTHQNGVRRPVADVAELDFALVEQDATAITCRHGTPVDTAPVAGIGGTVHAVAAG